MLARRDESSTRGWATTESLTGGRYDDAEGPLAEAQGIYDEIGERLSGATARWSRGQVALQRGRYEAQCS